MPKTKSAKKALRQNLRRKKTNLKKRTLIKTIIKKYVRLAGKEDKAEAKNYLTKLYKTLDKAASSGLLKKNAVRRLKSKLSRRLK